MNKTKLAFALGILVVCSAFAIAQTGDSSATGRVDGVGAESSAKRSVPLDAEKEKQALRIFLAV